MDDEVFQKLLASVKEMDAIITDEGKLRRLVDDNLDLSSEFIKDILVATAEVNAGQITPYTPRK
jgi:hypothetical protein